MVGWLIGGALALFFMFMLLSPLESLRWWSRRGAVQANRAFASIERPAPRPAREPLPQRFVIYLSGVGVLDGETLSRRERGMLDDLAEALPGVRVIAEVFPYAADNRGLLQRATSRMWDALVRWRTANRENLAAKLINVRNTLQVAVSADPRYGPTYNAGIAQQVWTALGRHGYTPGCGVPVTIVGYSGGAQMAVGATTMLTLLGVRVSVVGIGGVFGDDPGLDHVEHLWDVRGSRDRLRLLALVAFPGRWPVNRASTWNHAIDDRRVTVLDAGPAVHDGRGDYFDPRPGPDGSEPPYATVRRHLITALG